MADQLWGQLITFIYNNKHIYIIICTIIIYNLELNNFYILYYTYILYARAHTDLQEMGLSTF